MTNNRKGKLIFDKALSDINNEFSNRKSKITKSGLRKRLFDYYEQKRVLNEIDEISYLGLKDRYESYFVDRKMNLLDRRNYVVECLSSSDFFFYKEGDNIPRGSVVGNVKKKELLNHVSEQPQFSELSKYSNSTCNKHISYFKKTNLRKEPHLYK